MSLIYHGNGDAAVIQRHIDIKPGGPYNFHIISGEKEGKVFQRENKEKEKTDQEKEPIPSTSRLGPTFNLKGEISAKEDLIINGFFQGKIDLGNNNFILEQTGKLKADIHARNVTILGKMEGNIYASGKVFISKEAQMTGDISAFRISIMDGAQFKGSVKMSSSSRTLEPSMNLGVYPEKDRE
jgi:cytoskeletal protein CcmA (bactofilin family)